MVRHVEVLMMEQQLPLLILEDLDPYPPAITRRAPPPTECPKSRISGGLMIVENTWDICVDGTWFHIQRDRDDPFLIDFRMVDRPAEGPAGFVSKLHVDPGEGVPDGWPSEEHLRESAAEFLAHRLDED
jgi:hypothetical protein